MLLNHKALCRKNGGLLTKQRYKEKVGYADWVDRTWPVSTSIIANNDRSKRASDGRERDRRDPDIAEFQATAAGVGGAAGPPPRRWLGLGRGRRRRGFPHRSRREP